jgi:hypothetical protein
MKLDGRPARRFTARNVAYAGLGLASLIMPALAAGLIIRGGPGAAYAAWLFVITPVSGLLGVILNIRGLVRIREGLAGDYDLVLTWPGFFGAVLTCLFSMLALLTLAAA